ncbi:MAG: hypothetical protein Q4D38_08735 [Planctomycetia bacterium]|nr:hypothetical protein [Planctomycetia bacterium]
MKRTISHASRRGMVLMIVMALIAIFGIAALTFFLSTSQVKTAADQNRHKGTATLTPETMLNEAMMQVLRGSKSTDSVIAEYSILEDMYGYNAAPDTTTLTYAGKENGLLKFTGGSVDMAGRVITNIDPKSKTYGFSSVVVKCEGTTCFAIPTADGVTPESGEYLVNDIPFQGTLDYDAPDDNNRYLAKRDPETGEIVTPSFARNATDSTIAPAFNNVQADADNDGVEDSYWLDLGVPPRPDENGKMYKPLFAIVVEDLDGRLNLNAHGDFYDRTLAATTSNANVFGLGRGTAEIDLSVLGSGYEELMRARCGMGDSKPDYTANSGQKGGWYANYSGTLTGLGVQGSPYDIRGLLRPSMTTGRIGPVYDSASTSAPSTTPTGSATIPTQIGSTTNNPYDLDLGFARVSGIVESEQVSTNRDMPFAPAELEGVLRRYDADSPFLPNRIVQHLPNDEYYRRIITTESWDVPVVRDLGVVNASEDDYLPEVRAGFPIDLLRAATFNEQNDPWDGTCYPKRTAFATCLYNILESLNIDMGGDNGDRSRNNAQWAVNVVDFLDADLIITPFKIPGTNTYVYGCERPEILITETMAIHTRNTEPNVKEDTDHVGGELKEGPANKKDTKIYENYTEEYVEDLPEEKLEASAKEKVLDALSKLKDEHKPDGVMDFDQRLRPQGSLFVELYNPWNGTDAKDTSLYSADGASLELGKVVGGDAVWRLVVDKNVDMNDDPDADGVIQAERVLNLGNSTTTKGLTGADIVYSVSANSLGTNRRAIIGPEGGAVLSFNEPNEDSATQPQVMRKISLESRVFDQAALGGEDVVIPVPNQNNARFSLTESKNPYPTSGLRDLGGIDNILYSDAYDRPLDSDNEMLMKNGRHGSYRVIRLQRLADPTRAWDSQTNPYITIDSMPVDLTVFNARCTSADGDDPDTPENQYDIVSRKRGQYWYSTSAAERSNVAMIWSQENVTNNPETQVQITSQAVSQGVFTKDVVHAFGRWTTKTDPNKPFVTNATSGALNVPVPWMVFLNRPPVSPLELLNVPNVKPSRLLQKVSLESGATASNNFENNYGLRGYLPSFSGTKLRIFGYMRVPSLQTVTPMPLHTSNLAGGSAYSAQTELPYAYYCMYREPGKVNLNTIYSPDVLGAILNRSIATGDTLWTEFETRRDAGFRSISEVPASSFLGWSSLFASDTNAAFNTTYHPYFRYMQYYRLANLTTTRSNVFAVWITMGLFETDSSGTISSYELGSDTGGVKRYRAFYIIDRSIPVGFERGKNYNVDKAILLRRMLQ